MIPSISDTYNYIKNQSKGKEEFTPFVELGEIAIPPTFLDEVVKKRPYKIKTKTTNPSEVWEGGVLWHIYNTTHRNSDWFDIDFGELNQRITTLTQQFLPDFEICHASVFVLYPGGYIIPHIDRVGNPNELYLPFNWPEGTFMAWKDYGEIYPKCNSLYAFDTSKEHAIVNMSEETRYVYILGPKDHESFKSLFTQDNIS